ncbi:hypothetical protein P8452_52936 [Trifolium repens]|nr:hypothetical protein P8452_52936 [Trifolium repens]
MASTSGQQSRSKIRRVICNDYTEIILQEAAEFSKAYERTAMTQVISEYESIAIAKNIDEKHSIIIPYKQVESILRVFYLKFTTFCNTMRSHPNPVIKSKINFCPDDGSITPSTYQYQDISDDLRTEFETIISHYGLLKEIFSFTFQENFGPASGFKAQVGVVENSSTSSQCVTCIGMEDFVRVMDS